MTIDLEQIAGELARAAAWAASRATVEDPRGSLRAATLAPAQSLAATAEAERAALVADVAARRARALDEPPAGGLLGGRLVVYRANAPALAGAAEAASGGFFDGDDAPPWDTWATFADGALVALVPEPLLAHAERGVRAGGKRLAWLEESALPFADALLARLGAPSLARPLEHLVTLTLRTAAPARLRLEPWGDEYPLLLDKTYRVLGRGPVGGSLELVNEPGRLVVHAWPGATVDVMLGDAWLVRPGGDRPRAPAPAAPPTGEWFLYGVDGVRRYLIDKKDELWIEESGFSLLRHLGKYPCRIYVFLELPGMLHFRMLLPIEVPRDRREHVAAGLSAINMRNAVKGFEPYRDTVCFLTSVFLNADGTVSSSVIDQALQSVYRSAQRFLPEIESLAKG